MNNPYLVRFVRCCCHCSCSGTGTKVSSIFYWTSGKEVLEWLQHSGTSMWGPYNIVIKWQIYQIAIAKFFLNVFYETQDLFITRSLLGLEMIKSKYNISILNEKLYCTGLYETGTNI